DGHSGIQQPSAVFKAGGLACLAFMLGQFAAHGRQYIHRRHQAFAAAELVDHDQHMVARLAQHFQHLEYRRGFDDEVRLAGQFNQVDGAGLLQRGHHVLEVHDANDVGRVALAQRQARVPARELAHHVFGRVRHIQPDYFHARNHDRAYVAAAHGQHAFNKTAFFGGNRAVADDAVDQRRDFVAGPLRTRLAAAQQPQHRLGGALASSKPVAATAKVAASQLVAGLDHDREADGRVQVALGDVEAQSFGHQAEADHQEQAQAQDHHGGVAAHERHQRLAGQHHDRHGQHHRDHHDAEFLHHADSRDNGVQREHGVQHDNLQNDLPENRVLDCLRVAVRLPFDPFVQFHGALEEQEQAAQDQDQVAP